MSEQAGLYDALMEVTALHAQWHHAIYFADMDFLTDWVELFDWRLQETISLGQRENAAYLTEKIPEIKALWRALQADDHAQLARAEAADLIYQPAPPLDLANPSVLLAAAHDHHARMWSDLPHYQSLLHSIQRFSSVIIPAWKKTPHHESRDHAAQWIQIETTANEAFHRWLASLDRLKALLVFHPPHAFEPRLSMIQHRHCPAVHQALANPDLMDRLPRIGQCRTLEDFQCYWETLFYLMGALLGWASPAAGLAWWYAGGRQSHGDPRLDLIHSVWDDDGQLDYLAAHCWRGNSAFMHPDELSPAEMAVTSPWPDEDWWRAFKRQGRRFPHDPFYGGTNPLHLDLFACGRADPPDGSVQLIVHPVQPRRATLIVEDFASWRAALERFGNSLPEDPLHSWHVDVFHNPGGYLGLFRRSRNTGRWFQGKHHIHLAGNPQGR